MWREAWFLLPPEIPLQGLPQCHEIHGPLPCFCLLLSTFHFQFAGDLSGVLHMLSPPEDSPSSPSVLARLPLHAGVGGDPIKGVYRITELGWSPMQRWVWGDWESLPPAARRSILFSLHCQLFSASSCVQITLLSMFRLACNADCFGTQVLGSIKSVEPKAISVCTEFTSD